MNEWRTGLFQTTRLLAQEAVALEIPEIIELESHPDNRDFLWIGTEEEHLAEIVDKNHLLLVFREKISARLVGYALIRLNRASDVFEVRRIAISEKGAGFGKEAMRGLLRYAFEEWNANRFWLDVYPDNTIGMRLYESLGMKQDGVLRQSYKSSRGYLDQIIYSMLKDEYKKESI